MTQQKREFFKIKIAVSFLRIGIKNKTQAMRMCAAMSS
jgi:hypothetical protein